MSPEPDRGPLAQIRRATVLEMADLEALEELPFTTVSSSVVSAGDTERALTHLSVWRSLTQCHPQPIIRDEDTVDGENGDDGFFRFTHSFWGRSRSSPSGSTIRPHGVSAGDVLAGMDFSLLSANRASPPSGAHANTLT